MAAGGGDFERALGLRLALHLGEIRIRVRRRRRGSLEARQFRLAAQMRDDFQQRLGREYLRAFGERCLRRVLLGQHEGARRLRAP